MFSKAMISLFSISLGLFVSAGAWADSHHNGHDLVQDVHKAGTRIEFEEDQDEVYEACLLYTSPSPRDSFRSRMPSSA